ncbi:MAG: RIO1 family regulatory kinase/ATPase [Candidatus Thorarchaeota archaeon]
MEFLDEFNIDLTGTNSKALNHKRITTLQSLLARLFGDNFTIESAVRLESKKNVVLHLSIHSETRRITTSLVGKLYVSGNYDNELKNLKISTESGLSVPNVIGTDNGVILMSFIPGGNLANLINQTFQSEIIDKLATWYYKYHRAHAMIKGDPRLRNFIWNESQVFGLDFEESRKGHWILDIAGISASLLDTNPINDKRKRVLAWQFLEKYLECRGEGRPQHTDELFTKTVADILAQTAIRREDKEIHRLSEEVRKNGIPTD